MSIESTIVFTDHVARVVTVDTIAHDEWRAALVLRGELDASNASAVRAELDRHLDAGRRALRVDVRAVTFIDSTAVGALVAVNTRCAQEHGTLIITGARPMFLRLLKLSRLDEVLLIDRADH